MRNFVQCMIKRCVFLMGFSEQNTICGLNKLHVHVQLAQDLNNVHVIHMYFIDVCNSYIVWTLHTQTNESHARDYTVFLHVVFFFTGVLGAVVGWGVAAYRQVPSHFHSLSLAANFAVVSGAFFGNSICTCVSSPRVLFPDCTYATNTLFPSCVRTHTHTHTHKG